MSHPLLEAAAVDDAVLALRPDYRALLVTVTGVRGGPTDDASDAALRRAEESVRARLDGAPRSRCARSPHGARRSSPSA